MAGLGVGDTTVAYTEKRKLESEASNRAAGQLVCVYLREREREIENGVL